MASAKTRISLHAVRLSTHQHKSGGRYPTVPGGLEFGCPRFRSSWSGGLACVIALWLGGSGCQFSRWTTQDDPTADTTKLPLAGAKPAPAPAGVSSTPSASSPQKNPDPGSSRTDATNLPAKGFSPVTGQEETRRASVVPAVPSNPAPSASADSLQDHLPEQAIAQASLPPTAARGDAVGESAKLQELYQQAAQRYAQIDDYVCRFRRCEVLASGEVCGDMIMLRVRKRPFSLRFTWPKGSPDEGREVLYVQGRFNNQLVVRTGKGDWLAGLRIELAPDSPRATANTRRSLLQANVGYLVESLGQAWQSQQEGAYRFGRIRYLGRQPRPESATPLECALQEIPPGVEKLLPRGGRRYFYLATDSRLPECGLPVLIITQDDSGREVEYYCFDRFSINIGLRDEDFDPDRLWGRK